MARRRNFLIVLAYDGTDFAGWQRLPGKARTAQEEAEASLARALGPAALSGGPPFELVGAGRTDRGVHAEGQAASFHARTELDPDAIAAALNSELPPDMACKGCREVDPRFHARFRAKSKRYRYRLHVGQVPDPFARRYSLHVPGPLDLLGERDFAALSNAKDGDTLRRLDSALVEERREGTGAFVDLVFDGPGFLYNQARIMAAALLEAGEGRLSRAALEAIISSHDRAKAPGALGAFGLTLVEVRY
jgi:tRNA pseudouridine38-40 synthase